MSNDWWNQISEDDRERYAAAAKFIALDGCHGVKSAANLIGEEAARGLLADHIRRNVQDRYPGLDISGTETPEEIQRMVRERTREDIVTKLSTDEQKKVSEAEELLRKHGLYR